MEIHKDRPLLPFEDQALFETWLDANHTNPDGIWLKFAKKGSGLPTITYEQAREVALRYGWIDGQINTYDDSFYMRRFTPRRKRSKWSKINRAIVEELSANGKMMPTGLREVEAAKADGRWDAAYDSPSTMQVPEDFQTMLDADPKAKAVFEKLTRSNRYSILYNIHDAKRAETRTRRMNKYMAMLREGKGPNSA